MTENGHWHCEHLMTMIAASPENFKLCKYCSVPRAIFHADGRSLMANSAFEAFWEIDAERVKEDSGYNILSDEILNKRGLTDSVRGAFAGETVELEVSEFDFCDNVSEDISKHISKKEAKVSLAPVFHEGEIKAVSLAIIPDESYDDYQDIARKGRQLCAMVDSVVELRHEVNNPLLLITGNVQLILSKSDDLSPNLKGKLEKVLTNAGRIKEILDQYTAATNALLLNEDQVTID
jgi:nitrogen-specific signal transduction histidine kinase